MKKIQSFLIAAVTITAATSCNHGSTTYIETDVNNFSVKVQYSGTIVVNPEHTAVTSMSPNGFLKYDRNGQKLAVEADNSGHMMYELNDGTETNSLNANGKCLLAEAVKMIKKKK